MGPKNEGSFSRTMLILFASLPNGKKKNFCWHIFLRLSNSFEVEMRSKEAKMAIFYPHFRVWSGKSGLTLSTFKSFMNDTVLEVNTYKLIASPQNFNNSFEIINPKMCSYCLLLVLKLLAQSCRRWWSGL